MAKVEMRPFAGNLFNEPAVFPRRKAFSANQPLSTPSASHQPKTAKEPIAHNGTETPAVKETGE